MHKLDRTTVPTPTCLGNYSHPTHTWNDIGPDKPQVRAGLEAMQRTRCAYCEGPLYDGGHIEHFRRKRHHPGLTFSWSNMFLSCDASDHCGHYKDRAGALPYSPNHLVKPDVDDPDRYLFFHSSGEVRVREGLSQQDQNRANETIRVFHLDCGALVGARRRTIRQYERREPGILDFLISLCDEKLRNQFLGDELAATQHEPHWTVIRHLLEKAP